MSCGRVEGGVLDVDVRIHVFRSPALRFENRGEYQQIVHG